MEVTLVGVKTRKIDGYRVLRSCTTLTGLQTLVRAWERIACGEKLTVPILSSFGSDEDALNNLREHFELSGQSVQHASEREAVRLLESAKAIVVRLGYLHAVESISDAITSVQGKML